MIVGRSGRYAPGPAHNHVQAHNEFRGGAQC